MKDKTLIKILLSVIFILTLTLITVAIPIDVASANQSAEALTSSPNDLIERSRANLRGNRNNNNSNMPDIVATPEQCICNVGGYKGIKLSPTQCGCRNFCNPGRQCPPN